MKTTAFLAFVGAASALVARTPPVAADFAVPNTLIEYQRWCPVCDTVERNQACISQRAACQGSVLMYVSLGAHHIAFCCYQPLDENC